MAEEAHVRLGENRSIHDARVRILIGDDPITGSHERRDHPDGERNGLVYHCKQNNRVGLSPLGVVIVEALPRCLSVTAFHTFPDEFTVLKTQSLIEHG